MKEIDVILYLVGVVGIFREGNKVVFMVEIFGVINFKVFDGNSEYFCVFV